MTLRTDYAKEALLDEDGPITDKIGRKVAEMLRREVTPQLQAHEQKIMEHDNTLAEFAESFVAGLGRVFSTSKKLIKK